MCISMYKARSGLNTKRAEHCPYLHHHHIPASPSDTVRTLVFHGNITQGLLLQVGNRMQWAASAFEWTPPIRAPVAAPPDECSITQSTNTRMLQPWYPFLTSDPKGQTIHLLHITQGGSLKSGCPAASSEFPRCKLPRSYNRPPMKDASRNNMPSNQRSIQMTLSPSPT